jgi:hypothetical protein
LSGERQARPAPGFQRRLRQVISPHAAACDFGVAHCLGAARCQASVLQRPSDRSQGGCGSGGNLRCVNWSDVALAGLAGALTGGLAQGSFAWKMTGSNTWNATRAWINRAGLFPGRAKGTHLHHGIVEQGSTFGKAHRELVNHPWNLRPVSPELHQQIHHEFGAIRRWWYGHPEWLIGTELSVGGYVTSKVLDVDCGC